MHVHVYVTTEKYEFDIDALNHQVALEEALKRAKEGRGVPIASECRYLALLADEEQMVLRRVQRGSHRS